MTTNVVSGRRVRRFGAAIIAVFAMGVSAYADTGATWNGATDNWSKAADWSTNPNVPNNGNPAGALYDVTIPSGKVTSDINPTVSVLTVSGTLDVNVVPSGNSVTVTGTFTNNAGGSFSLDGTGDVGNVGTLANQGHVFIGSGATLNLTGGGSGITDVPAGAMMTVVGAVNVINGSVSTNGLANFTSAEGEMDLVDGHTHSLASLSTGAQGVINIDYGTTVTVSGNVTNSGLFETGGFLNLLGATGNSVTVTGTFTNNVGASLAVGPMTGGSDSVTIGALVNQGAVVVYPGTILTLNGLSGTGGIALTGAILNVGGSGVFTGTISDGGSGGIVNSVGNATTGPVLVGTLNVQVQHKIGFGGGTSKVANLLIAGSTNGWTGGLDITNNDFIVQPGNAAKGTVLSALQNQAVYGKTHTKGIYSNTLPLNMAVAVVDNGALVTPKGSFGGLPVDLNSILVGPELLGDANVDGNVTLTDLATVLNNFGQPTNGWWMGNFDGASTVDLTDLAAVLNNFGSKTGGPTEVPEPGTLGVLVAVMGGLMLRRKRG